MSTPPLPYASHCLSRWRSTRGQRCGCSNAGVPRDLSRWSSSAPEPSSAQAAVELHEDRFDHERRQNDHDQSHDPMEGSAETYAVTEREDERFENHELEPEQDQPCSEEAHEFVEASRPRVEEGGDPMLHDDRELQEDLQQHGGE